MRNNRVPPKRHSLSIAAKPWRRCGSAGERLPRSVLRPRPWQALAAVAAEYRRADQARPCSDTARPTGKAQPTLDGTWRSVRHTQWVVLCGAAVRSAGFRSSLSELDLDGFVHSHPKKTRQFYHDLVRPFAARCFACLAAATAHFGTVRLRRVPRVPGVPVVPVVPRVPRVPSA